MFPMLALDGQAPVTGSIQYRLALHDGVVPAIL